MPKLPSVNFFEVFKACLEIFSWIRMKHWILNKMKHFDEFLLRDMIKEYVPMKHFCAF